MRTRRKTHDEPPRYSDKEVRLHAFRYGWSYHQMPPRTRRVYSFSEFIPPNNDEHQIRLWYKYRVLGTVFVGMLAAIILVTGFALILTETSIIIGTIIAVLGVLVNFGLPIWSERKYL